MKRKLATKIPPSQPVHFYPGAVGTMIGKYARQLKTSPGDAAKRLVTVALELSDADSKKTAHKRQPAKSNEARAPIHFRPNQKLGCAIAERAVRWKLSRGETAKRLISLALYGLDTEYYETVDELKILLGESSQFEEACSCIAVHIAQVELIRPLPTKPDRLREAKSLLDPYRFTYKIEEEAEKQRQQAKIYLTSY